MGLWQELIEQDSAEFIECCEELAKHYEHRTKEISKAISTVEQAMNRTERHAQGTEAALRKRLERLIKKGRKWQE